MKKDNKIIQANVSVDHRNPKVREKTKASQVDVSISIPALAEGTWFCSHAEKMVDKMKKQTPVDARNSPKDADVSLCVDSQTPR